MTKDTAIIERFRDELAALRHVGGQLVARLRERELSEAERQTIAAASKACQAVQEKLAKLIAH